VNNPSPTPAAIHESLNLGDARLYVATAAMVAGNILLPLALHQIPDAGRMFLPIFFFTLIAGWRFGAQAAVLTAVLSPMANHFLTGMPPSAALQEIILQSALLGALAALAAARFKKPTLAVLTLVVLAHQVLVLFPTLIHAGWHPCLAALKFRLPGLLLQILGGFSVLWLMGRYLPQAKTATREG
jgi:4-amino-4-deoxy-L-arabinose transferase-like glycosyltransferase